MTSIQRKVIRRTRRLTWSCYIAIAAIDAALFIRRERRTLAVIGAAALGVDLFAAYKFGWL